MKKLFSLLSGTEVRLAPGQKIIPADELTKLEDAAAIVEIAKKETEEFKEKATKEGYDAGFQQGLEALNKHLFALNHELQTLRDDIQKKILPLSLKAARKIMGEELRIHPDRIVDIVMNSLKPVTQHKKIVIYVNKADLQLLEENKPKFKEIFDHLESLSIQERSDIEPGGCIIETEAGIINAQLENQWRALESAFESFMKK
jgi:type III secretion protein L